MGKWTAFKSKLSAFELEPDYAAKVEAAKGAYIGLSTAEMAWEFSLNRNTKQKLENEIKLTNIELEALSQLLVNDLESSDMQKVQLTSGETCYINSEPYTTVIDKEKLMAWVKKSKLQNLLTLPWQTLNGMSKGRLLSGREPISGTSVFLKTAIRIRGGNQEEE
jgi:hypothetical protein